MPEYLTTKELAELLRIKERKVYDLAASGEVPCSRATGKLLFARKAIEAWIAEHSSGRAANIETRRRPIVFLGSHDPLLDWALRQSECELASYFDGSSDGLSRFAAGEGVSTGLHIFDEQNDTWNVSAVRKMCAGQRVVLLEWAKRQRGIIHSGKIGALDELEGQNIVPRQDGAGAQSIFQHTLRHASIDESKLSYSKPARSEQDAALAVVEGKADAAFGLECYAAQYQLAFLPVIEERFDILVDRKAWFEPALQKLDLFCRSKSFRDRAAELKGYNVDGFGTVWFNA